MSNPWVDLPEEPPFVLPADADWVGSYNRERTRLRQEQCRLELASLPDPYVGDPTRARVVLLALNPGHDEEDVVHQRRPGYEAHLRRTLHHEEADCPFYLLDPRWSGHPGQRWWSTRLRVLIERCGLKRVCRHLAVIEWFPYHSRRFLAPRETSVAQPYSWELARRAVADPSRVVVLMRGRRFWEHSLGPLLGVLELSSKQAVHVTPRNVGLAGFERLCDALMS